MTEKEKTVLEVIDGGEQKESKPKTTKRKTAKKLTATQMKDKAKEVRQVKKINLEIGGEKFYYEIDTNPTTTRQADFVQNVKVLTAYVSTEQAFNAFSEKETSMFMAGMVLAELMNIFSTLEVGDTIEEKVQFIATLNDVGILQEVSDNIPDGLRPAITNAEESVTALVEDLTKQASEIEKKIIDLEKLKIEEDETKGE